LAIAVLNHLNVLFQTAKGLAENQDFEAETQPAFFCVLVLEWVSIYRDIFNLFLAFFSRATFVNPLWLIMEGNVK